MRITLKITCRGFTKWIKSIVAYFAFKKETGIKIVPSSSLRYRVHSAKDLYTFLEVGKTCANNIKSAVEKSGDRLNAFERILDFGCGCGRTIIYLSKNAPLSAYHGTDIDKEAIEWCNANIPDMKFNVNDALPPLPYPSDYFDMIYSISVFTHLDEFHQFKWLDELKRILAPKGLLLFSVHGRNIWGKASPDNVAEIERKGFFFKRTEFWKEFFPDWYGDAYHTENYIRSRLSNGFKVIDYIPCGVNNHQDMVMLQKH